jgi:hypothetical protein
VWLLKGRIALQYELGEVSAMRKLMAVAVLGAGLALSTGAAFASENGNTEYLPPFQAEQSVTTSQAGSDQSMVAGGNEMGSRPYEQLHNENFGGGR